MKRTHLAAMAAAAVTVAAVAVLTAGGSGGSLRRGAGGGTPSPAPTGTRDRTAAPSPSTASLSGTLTAAPGVDPSATASGAPLGTGGPFLVVGSERDNRAMVTRLSDVRADLRTGTERFRARLVTAQVGAAYAMLALPGQRLAVNATNQPELVLLTDGLTRIKSLDLRPAVGAPREQPFRMGAMSLHAGTLYVGVAWGNNVAVVAVDTARWQVTKTHALTGRVAMHPPTCMTGDGVLAVLTSGHLSLLRPDDLRSVAEVEIDGRPLGLACAGREVLSSDNHQGVVYRHDSTGRARGTLAWEGKGASVLHHAGGVLYGNDEETRKVFRCDLKANRCTTSAALTGHTDSLLRSGDLLFAAHDSERVITVLDADTFAVRGSLPIPGGPRAFALLP